MFNLEGIEKVKALMKELGIIGEIIYHEKSGKTTEEAEAALGVQKKIF